MAIPPETGDWLHRHFTTTGDSLDDIGVISVVDSLGYLYFVPIQEKFYRQSHMGVEKLSFLSDSIIKVPSEHPVFSKARAHHWIKVLLEVCSFSGLWVLDIGAFIGDFSLMFSAEVQKADKPPGPLQLFAFEPNFLNINLLRANISLNALRTNLKVVPSACSSFDGTHEFICWNRARIGGQLMNSESSEPGIIKKMVDVVRVDTFLNRYPVHKKDAICVKIDTEGNEAAVVSGFGKYLHQICLCILEYWPQDKGNQIDGVAFSDYLAYHFDILMMNNSLFSLPLPWRIIKSGEDLNKYAEKKLQKKRNLDIACVNKAHPLRDKLIALLT
jgi:FkbM family methyltransferase